MNALLPPNATVLERALATVGADLVDVPVPLHLLKSPDAIPEHLLPYLAWELSVDIWDDAWAVEVKRDVVRRAMHMHALKGTLEGARQHVRLVGSEVVAARVPPDGFYPEPSLTKDEREAFLSRFRQLRFYPFRERSTAKRAAFLGRGWGLSRLFIGRFYPATTDAAARIGTRTFVFDPLTDQEVAATRVVRTDTTEESVATTLEQVSIPGLRSGRLFAGDQPRAAAYTAAGVSRARVYTLRRDVATTVQTQSLHLTTTLPSVEPIDVRPKRVAITGRRGFGSLFCRRGGEATEFTAPGRIFLPPSSANLRIYDVIYLHDPDRVRRGARRARAFVGRIRLGMPPYHAQLSVRIPRKRSRKTFGRFLTGFLVRSDYSDLARARDALAVSKAVRDKILMTTRTLRPLTFGDAPRVADGVQVGEWTSAL